jgi:predicted ATPase
LPSISELSKVHPLIEKFQLIGINKYKTLTLDCKHAVKIVAAENGSGKTTLLNALYAVLSLNFSALASVDFRAFKLKIKNYPVINFNKSDLFHQNYAPQISKSIAALKNEGLSDQRIRKAVSYIRERGIDSFGTSSEFLRIYYDSPRSREDLLSTYQVAASEYQINSACEKLIKQVEAALAGTKILYLPTFRRIESEFAELDVKKPRKRNFDLWYPSTDDYEDGDEQLIWFGMADVESKLDIFRSRIKNRTSESYSRISAQSLEDLLSPTTKIPSHITPDDKDFTSQISLVLARLGRSGGEIEARISDLIYSGSINHPEYDGLRAHLFQILSIYATTQAQELAIEGFTTVVNNYWNASSYEPNKKPSKYFVFDKFSLSTDVINAYDGKPLSLNNLSSGEKQIVSVFAKLYLREQTKYIVLIDEPELSLAMTWQQMFLKDILESPSCEQLVAITHSPFIFDNELDKYAEPLVVTHAGS